MSRTIVALVVFFSLVGCQTLSSRSKLHQVRLQTVSACNSCNQSYPSYSGYSDPCGVDCCDGCVGGCRVGRGRRCSDCTPPHMIGCFYWYWWDTQVTRYTAHRCALHALHAYRRQCGRLPSHDFKMGFIRAYEDLALNRLPRPPIVPASKYWNAYYRSCAGQPAVEDWFNGYDAGLNWGSQSGVSQFHQVNLNLGANCDSNTGNSGGSAQTIREIASQQNSRNSNGYQPQNQYVDPGQQYGYPGQN